MTNPAKNIDIEVVYRDAWTDSVTLYDDNKNPLKLSSLSATSNIVVVDKNGAILHNLSTSSELSVDDQGKISISGFTWSTLFDCGTWGWYYTVSGARELIMLGAIKMIRAPGDETV